MNAGTKMYTSKQLWIQQDELYNKIQLFIQLSKIKKRATEWEIGNCVRKRDTFVIYIKL